MNKDYFLALDKLAGVDACRQAHIYSSIIPNKESKAISTNRVAELVGSNTIRMVQRDLKEIQDKIGLHCKIKEGSKMLLWWKD